MACEREENAGGARLCNVIYNSLHMSRLLAQRCPSHFNFSYILHIRAAISQQNTIDHNVHDPCTLHLPRGLQPTFSSGSFCPHHHNNKRDVRKKMKSLLFFNDTQKIQEITFQPCRQSFLKASKYHYNEPLEAEYVTRLTYLLKWFTSTELIPQIKLTVMIVPC